MRTLNARAERMLKALDESTTEQYKNKQREQVYDDIWRDVVLLLVWRKTLFFKHKYCFIVCGVCCMFAFTSYSRNHVSHDPG